MENGFFFDFYCISGISRVDNRVSILNMIYIALKIELVLARSRLLKFLYFIIESLILCKLGEGAWMEVKCEFGGGLRIVCYREKTEQLPLQTLKKYVCIKSAARPHLNILSVVCVFYHFFSHHHNYYLFS